MNKKQINTLKKVLCCLAIAISCYHPVFADENQVEKDTIQLSGEQLLAKADSLFEIKKFTESQKLYEYLLFERKEASPAMLLKMAFVSEGLGNFARTLYYLTLYQQEQPGPRVNLKINELAKKYKLEGYERGDADWFNDLIHMYRYWLMVLFSLAAVLSLFYMFYRKFKKQKQPGISIVMLIVFVIGIAFCTYYQPVKQAIIMTPQTMLMAEPSAGSDRVLVLGPGHKLIVLSKGEVWTQVRWNDQKVFVRSNKVYYL